MRGPDQFDRADFGMRLFQQTGARKTEASPASAELPTPTTDGDASITALFLAHRGWGQADIEAALSGPEAKQAEAEADASPQEEESESEAPPPVDSEALWNRYLKARDRRV